MNKSWNNRYCSTDFSHLNMQVFASVYPRVAFFFSPSLLNVLAFKPHQNSYIGTAADVCTFIKHPALVALLIPSRQTMPMSILLWVVTKCLRKEHVCVLPHLDLTLFALRNVYSRPSSQESCSIPGTQAGWSNFLLSLYYRDRRQFAKVWYSHVLPLSLLCCSSTEDKEISHTCLLENPW